jgi:hypothetical protein
MVFQSKTGVDVERTVQNSQFKIATNSKIFSILFVTRTVLKKPAMISARQRPHWRFGRLFLVTNIKYIGQLL